MIFLEDAKVALRIHSSQEVEVDVNRDKMEDILLIYQLNLLFNIERALAKLADKSFT